MQSNIRYIVRDDHRLKGSAIVERIVIDLYQTVRKGARNEIMAVRKCTVANTLYPIWDGDGCEMGTKIEGRLANMTYAARDNGIGTTYEKTMVRGFYNGIAVVTTVENRIPAFHLYFGKIIAHVKRAII